MGFDIIEINLVLSIYQTFHDTIFQIIKETAKPFFNLKFNKLQTRLSQDWHSSGPICFYFLTIYLEFHYEE